MNNIIEKLSLNESINQLLDTFKKEFIRNYNKASELERIVMERFRDSIYRKWLFSPFNEGNFVTPSCIINNFAQIYEKGNYTVCPHMNISIENNKISFEIKWLTYNEVESPVLDDLYMLLNECSDNIIVREGKDYLIENGEEILDKLNFRSGYYLMFLIGLGERLGIFKEVKAIGCKNYKITFKEFNKLKDKDKIKRIISESIELSNYEIKNELKIKDSKVALEMLDNSVDREIYNKYIEEKAKQYNSVFNNLSMAPIDKNFLDVLKNLEGELGTSAQETMAYNDIGIAIDKNFTSVFGYYLGIVNPVYNEIFFIDIFLKLVCSSLEQEQVLGLLFTLELGHDLSEFGKYMIKDIKGKLRKEIYKNIDEKQLKLAIEYYIENKDEILNEELSIFENDSVFEKVYDEFNMLEDDLSVEVKNHIIDFYGYLYEVKKLKEKTCNKHCENIELYMRFCLEIESLENLGHVNKESIHLFLLDFFIPKIATSKTNVKDVITSLSQYLRYVEQIRLVNQDLVNECKALLKEKERYIEYFEECIDEDYFW